MPSLIIDGDAVADDDDDYVVGGDGQRAGQQRQSS